MPSQEGYRPPTSETTPVNEAPIEKTEVDVPKEARMPSIDDLDALLSGATSTLERKEGIDEMIERRKKSLDRLRDFEMIQESRLRIVENYNPLGNLKPSDYDRLIQEKIIDEKYAERLKKIDDLVVKFQSINYPSTETQTELERLLFLQGTIREKIEAEIQEKQEEVSLRRETTKNNVLEHYGKRIKELEQTIKDIESNPLVLEQLQVAAAEEMRAVFAQKEAEKRAFEEKIGQERMGIIREASRYIQSLVARHNNAFRRIGELLENEKIADELIEALKEEDKRKKQSTFDRIRSRLIKAIIEGEGEKQLKEPREVVPWRVAPTSIQYKDAIGFLNSQTTKEVLSSAAESDNERIKKLQEELNQVISENEALRQLFGAEFVTNYKTNEKRMGVFWAAFQTRKKNDKDGITEARRREHGEIARQEAETQKLIEGIISRGGFAVEAPIIKDVRGKKTVVGKEMGAIRLEKRKSKKGNDYCKVVEISGRLGEVKVGDTSPLDMSSFPQWLAELARVFFAVQAKNLIENLFDSE